MTAGLVDVAVIGDFSVGLAGPLLAVGIDPKLAISRHFRYSKKREFFVGLTGGGAITLASVSRGPNEKRFGFLAGATLGLDLAPKLRFTLDVGVRDEIKRVGGSLSTYF